MFGISDKESSELVTPWPLLQLKMLKVLKELLQKIIQSSPFYFDPFSNVKSIYRLLIVPSSVVKALNHFLGNLIILAHAHNEEDFRSYSHLIKEIGPYLCKFSYRNLIHSQLDIHIDNCHRYYCNYIRNLPCFSCIHQHLI